MWVIRYRPDTDLGQRWTATSGPFPTREAAEHVIEMRENGDQMEAVEVER